jgi:hypothetical protein
MKYFFREFSGAVAKPGTGVEQGPLCRFVTWIFLRMSEERVEKRITSSNKTPRDKTV